eukprot:4325555-Prymnesium_polylepis.1
MVDRIHDERDATEADGGRQPHCRGLGPSPADGPHNPVDRRSRYQHGGQRLPQQRVARLQRRFPREATLPRHSARPPRRVREYVAACGRICGRVDKRPRHERTKSFADLVGVAKQSDGHFAKAIAIGLRH